MERRPATVKHMYETMRLSRDAVEGITHFGARASWPPGITVYERGAPADGVFVVLTGRIVLRSRIKAGRGYIPLIVTPGGTFGGEGLAAVSPTQGHYVTEARADGATETLHLGGMRFRAMAREQPTLALALVSQLMAEQATLLDKLRERATLSVEQRLVMSVVRMARQHTCVDTDGRLALDAPPLSAPVRARGRHAGVGVDGAEPAHRARRSGTTRGLRSRQRRRHDGTPAARPWLTSESRKPRACP
jgi:CRP-like cAMP-binding protein